MKSHILNGHKFIIGWTRCSYCDKRIKFDLDETVAALLLQNFEECRNCFWERFSDNPKANLLFKTIFPVKDVT